MSFKVSKKLLNDTLNNTFSNLENDIVEYLKQNKEIKSVKEISNYLEKSDSTIKRTLKKLVDKNIIVRVGSKKNGYWEAR